MSYAVRVPQPWRTVPALALAALLSACSGGGTAEIPGTTEGKIGFIFVGFRRDLGYNQAAWEASEAVARAFPERAVLRRESVPETSQAEEHLEEMVAEGATVLFATSLGHLPAAVAVARRHPEVTVLHQGGIEPRPGLDNLGTYFGSIHEQAFLTGIAAGAASRSGRLGFVAGFPVPSVFNHVNAFTLGARTVKADAVTEVRFSGRWCDPPRQEELARELLAGGADILAQHQDCTGAILAVAEAEGAMSVGFHYDGSEVARSGWVTGSVWVWRDLFIDIVQTIAAGRFSDSAYNGDFRGVLAAERDPLVLTELGPAAEPGTQALIDQAATRIKSGTSPFAGPLRDREGRLRVQTGSAPSFEDINGMDWFVAGVVGEVPRLNGGSGAQARTSTDGRIPSARTVGTLLGHQREPLPGR